MAFVATERGEGGAMGGVGLGYGCGYGWWGEKEGVGRDMRGTLVGGEVRDGGGWVRV